MGRSERGGSSLAASSSLLLSCSTCTSSKDFLSGEVTMVAGKEVEPEVVSCRLPGPHCRPPTPYLGSAPGPGRHLTFHWAAAYLAGARLPPYHASQCQRHWVLQGALQHCMRGHLGARRGNRGQGMEGAGAFVVVVQAPGRHPSLSQQ